MPTYPSHAPTPELAELFPTYLPDVEALVYGYVEAATAYGLASGIPALSFYADRARAAAEQRQIEVVRGWPAFPGVVPAIGVAQGTDGEDQQHQTMSGGFAGDVVQRADAVLPGADLLPGDVLPAAGGEILGSASYYAEPLTAAILVLLIHENRDERDRLHNELRRVLFPIRRYLLEADRQIKKVSVDAEKDEQDAGPPDADEPLLVYTSTFTVQVGYEMLEATNVTGPESVLARIDVAVEPSDSGS